MIHFFEQLVARIWNRFRGRERGAWHEGGSLDLGFRVADSQVTGRHVMLSNARRAMHVAVLGKTGSGKSSLLRYLSQQDIAADRGFVYFDLHGDATPFLLGTINARERREHRHLSDKLVVIAPADPLVSVGLNPLEEADDFVRIGEFTQVLRQRWSLDHFGARTDELLRNSLYVLAANSFTLLELAPLLTHAGFRAACLKHVSNAEVRQYFELRYDQVSEAMRATMREPILNKTSAFTADPRFRHIVGQVRSTLSLREAMDDGYWVIVNLEKGRLGEQALTLGSLILTMLKNALFSREKRSLFTVYCDEIQNLVAYGSGIETILSEARKFGVAIVSANQFLDQYPAEMRAAILAVGTHAFFQLSSADAAQVAQALDGGKPLAERLKNLPSRRAIVKSGPERWTEISVPTVREPQVDSTDLLNRTRFARGRVRTHIERDIAKRQAAFARSSDEVLHEWE
jgi:energy-coupling factor transporter ATP-binding protein EcfA2